MHSILHIDSFYYCHCLNNPVKNIDPDGMDVWSTTDPGEIRRAIESLLRGGSFRYNDNWTHTPDDEFLNLRGSYSAGLNYNSRTGQLWFLSGGGIGEAFVSQLTWVPGKGFIEHPVGRYELLGELGRNKTATGFADYFGLGGDIGGPMGESAKNILDNRGAYMPKGQIYQQGNKSITVRTPVANINTTAKTLNFFRVGGKILVVGGVVATGYQVGDDIASGKYYSASTRAFVFGVGAGAAFIPVAGWGVAAGIGVADFIWGDVLYDWVETKTSN